MVRLTRSFALFALLSGVGCGPRLNPTFEKTVPVRGFVVLANGTPVRGGRVTFHPKDPNRGEARGMLGRNGRFELGTYQKADGAMPGAYTVTVEPIVYDTRGNLRRDRSLPVSARYGDPRSSGLTAEVTDNGGETVKLVLR